MRPKRLKPELVEDISKFWKTNEAKCYTVQEIREHLKQRHPDEVIPSITTVRRYLRNALGLSYKRVSWRPLKTSTGCFVNDRLMYIKFIQEAEKEGCVVIQIDEFSVNRNSYPSMWWSKKRQSGYSFQEMANESFSNIAAISSSWIEWLAVSKSRTNGDVFCAFLKKLISEIKRKYDIEREKVILTWDGARYHLMDKVKTLLVAEGIMMVQTVAYTPEFSPVELFINWVKNKIRKRIRKFK